MVTLPDSEHPDFFNTYLQYAEEDIGPALTGQLISFPGFVREIPEEKELYRYAPGKWTIKEVVGHCTDTERIMFYRAFTIARNDRTPLSPFDDEAYVLATDFNGREMEELVSEFETTRKNTIALFDTLSEEELRRIGTASGHPTSSRALFYFIIGHLAHHERLLRERYLEE